MSRDDCRQVWEHAFVSIKGSPGLWLQRALDAGQLTAAIAAAHELPTVNLVDALRLVALMARERDGRYSRAAARWLGRLAVERPGVTLADLDHALDALERLPAQAADALVTLTALCERSGSSGPIG